MTVTAIGADNLTCEQLRKYRPKGEAWANYLQALSRLLEGGTSLVILIGYYGSGKTLFIRRSIVEFAYYYPIMVPIHLKLGDVERYAEHVQRTTRVEYLLASAVDHMLERYRGRFECMDEDVVASLEKLRDWFIHTARRREIRESVGVLALLEEASKNLSLRAGRLVLFVDEFERICRYVELERLAYPVLVLVRDLVKNMYELASGTPGYGVVIASVFRFTELAAYLLELLAQHATKPEARLAAEHAKLLEDIVKAIADNLALEARMRIRHILSRIGVLDPDRLRSELASLVRQLERRDPLAPNISSRIQQSLVELVYKSEDYAEMLGEMRECKYRLDGQKTATILAALEAVNLPPRYLLSKNCDLLTNPVNPKVVLEIKELIHETIRAEGAKPKQLHRFLEALLDHMYNTGNLLISEEQLEQLAKEVSKNPGGLIYSALSQQLLKIKYVNMQTYYYYLNPETGIPYALLIGSLDEDNPRNPLKKLRETIVEYIRSTLKARKRGRRKKPAKQTSG